MLIDTFLPEYQYRTNNQIEIQAPVEEVYAKLKIADFEKSKIITWLFLLRGLSKEALKLKALQRLGFIELAEIPNDEYLLGLIGKFWKPTGDLQRIASGEFRGFNQAGYVKTAWNFTVKSVSINTSILATETRIQCTDQKSLNNFRDYWTLIKPFSILIRKEMLRTIKEEVESDLHVLSHS